MEPTLDDIEQWLPECTANYSDGRPAIGLGLIITLFFRNGHLPEIREKVLIAMDKFYGEFRDKLKKHDGSSGFSKITPVKFEQQRQRWLAEEEHMVFSWEISSANDSESVPEYSIAIMGNPDYCQQEENSVIKLTLPWHFLKEPQGSQRYQNWISYLCNTLPIEHGYAGLSSILPYDEFTMFPYEYQLAKRFSGLMVDSISLLNGSKFFDHIKGACWYTILGERYIERLGGKEAIEKFFDDDTDIQLILYNNGIIIKAGKLPSMGEMNSEGLPPLLVKVNRLIKPIRLQETNSLHFYSPQEDFQFEEESTRQWYQRFDDPQPEPIDSHPLANLPRNTQGYLELMSGEICPHAGQWSSWANGQLVYQHMTLGQTLPQLADQFGILRQQKWTLLKPEPPITDYPQAKPTDKPID